MVQVSVARGWDLEIDRGPDWLFVRPRPVGAGAPDAPALGEQVLALLEQAMMHRLVLELDDIEHLDARLIDQLVLLNDRIHAREGIMRICGLSAANQRLLRERHLEGQIAHYCDREAAVMCQDRPKRPR
jgi:anti-anti-sigma regulatory factor